MTADQALELVHKLLAKLQERQPDIRRHLSYMTCGSNSAKTLPYASDKFSEYHARRFADFRDNWCDPVLQAPTERMHTLGLIVDEGTREADVDLSRVWRENDAERGAAEAWLLACGVGRAFALVWGDPDDEATPRVTFEHPANCIVAYDADTGRPTAGLKMWADDDATFATLYTATEVWKWKGPSPSKSSVILPAGVSAQGWEPRQASGDMAWPLPNPMGRVPLVEFRNQALLDDCPRSDIAGVEAMQDAINLVWAYLFNSLDYASLPQRVLLGADVPKVPVLDKDGKQTGERPVDLERLIKDRVLFIPSPSSDKLPSASSWEAASLDVFAAVITQCVEHIAAQTRTPAHYLLTKMINTSAEALTVSETGLVARTNERIAYFTGPLRSTYALIAEAQGETEKAREIRSRGKVLWADPQYRSIGQKTDAFQKLVAAGLPMEWCLEWYGLPPDEVARVMAMGVSPVPAAVDSSVAQGDG